MEIVKIKNLSGSLQSTRKNHDFLKMSNFLTRYKTIVFFKEKKVTQNSLEKILRQKKKKFLCIHNVRYKR